MTVFDKIDPSRVRVQGKWATRKVWINGEKLTPSRKETKHLEEDTKPALYGWGSEHSNNPVFDRDCTVNLCSDICNYIEKVLHIPITYAFYRMLTETLFQNMPQTDFDIIINTRGWTAR